MKFCERHWSGLRKAIDDLGLTPQVAKSGEEAVTRLVAGVPDPLIEAHNMILNRAMEMVGLGLMFPDEDGKDRCPQCEVSKACAASDKPCGKAECADEWTESATAAIAKWRAEAEGRTA